MSWSADEVAGYLALHRPEKWRVRIESDPAWLKGHPGGFGSVDLVSVGETIPVNPDRLAELLAGADDRTASQVLDALIVWWEWSMWERTLQEPERGLAQRFAEEHAIEAGILATLASWASVEIDDLLVY